MGWGDRVITLTLKNPTTPLRAIVPSMNSSRELAKGWYSGSLARAVHSCIFVS